MSGTCLGNSLRVAVLLLAAAILSLIPSGYALAQNTFGSLSNFDVFNDTGQETNGFEIELDDISSTDVVYKFGGTNEQYNDPVVQDFNNGVTKGVKVRYQSPYVSGQFTIKTLKAQTPITATAGHACWRGGIPPQGLPAYPNGGCEHFGLGLAKTPSKTLYHWLIPDPQNAGQLIDSPSKVTVPAPVQTLIPPAVVGNPPAVQAVVPAQPPEAAEFGNAQWVKVYMTETPDPVDLNHMVTDDPVVPQSAAEVETEWFLLQLDSGNPAGARNELSEQKDLGAGNQSVTRRFEFYKFAGSYDPVSHEALPKVSDSNPQPAEIGDYEGAQIAAVNLVSPTATATATATPTSTATPTPLPGQLSAAPSKLNFGTAVFGGIVSQGQVITKFTTLTNTSKTSPAPIDPTATEDFRVVSGGKKGCTTQLAVKRKCTIGVSFQPTDFGPRSGILSIGGVHVATLSGNGIAGNVAVSPGTLNFGKVHTGTKPTKFVTLNNKSPVPIEISGVEVFNDTTDFSVDQKCVGALLTKTPCSITVTFTPSTAGKKSAQLKISHAGAGSHNLVNLVGTAF